jgi:hypothetical protein
MRSVEKEIQGITSPAARFVQQRHGYPYLYAEGNPYAGFGF